MHSESRSFNVSAELISILRDHFRRELDTTYSDDEIAAAIDVWLDSRFERMIDEIAEVITSPYLAESQHFREILESSNVVHNLTNVDDVPEAAASNVFNGFRAFSPAKLGAMIEHIAASGWDIYKTNLNKLLFYSDLTYFYIHRRGISGATYLNLPFGPVPDTVEDVVDTLAAAGRIRKLSVTRNGNNAQMIKPGRSDNTGGPKLSKDEIEMLDWVIGQYGHLSPTEISDLSHREKAYASTRPSEPIAYEYSKFFKCLPTP